MDELVGQFLLEGRELLQQATEDLLALERDPRDAARLAEAFRAVHTLKGSTGLFDLAPMGRALHAAEDVLAALRAGTRQPDAAGFAVLLRCLAACAAWLEAFASHGALPEGASAESAALVAALLRATPEAAVDWVAPLLAGAAPAVAAARAAGQRVVALRYVPRPDCFFLGDDPMALARDVPGLLALELRDQQDWAALGDDPYRCNLVLEMLSTAAPEELRRLFRFVADQVEVLEPAVAPAATAPDAAAAPTTLRVEAARVDTLVELVGELTVAKNALAHLVAGAAAGTPAAQALAAEQLALDGLVGRLHRAAMALRLTPLRRVFRRFPLLVRDMAAQLGKQVAFTLEGDQLEADRVVVDGLAEPLLHLLRNALDHGIEAPAQRLAAGKPAAGTLVLAARQQGEQLLVTLADDGAGLDPARLRRLARERGVLGAAELAGLDDAASRELIFLPGFSTAAAVTEISGRGVGMQAVRAAVRALGGQVSVASTLGQGTLFTLALPLSVSLTTVVTVGAGGEVHGVPLAAVVETLTLPAARILPLGAGEAFAWRDRTLPLLRLDALLGGVAAPRCGTARLLVVQAGGQLLGLEVDAVLRRLELAMRPPSGLLARMPGLLGTGLQGDGRVLLVLNLEELLA